MNAIHFFYEEVDYTLSNDEKIREWIIQLIEKEKYKAGELNFIFSNDEYLYELNMNYLNHDTYTDIITFDMSERDEEVGGDVFISVDRARENAKTYEQELDNEIIRLIAHGLLHLVGYGDKSPEEQKEMRAKENEYIELYSELT